MPYITDIHSNKTRKGAERKWPTYCAHKSINSNKLHTTSQSGEAKTRINPLNYASQGDGETRNDSREKEASTSAATLRPGGPQAMKWKRRGAGGGVRGAGEGWREGRARTNARAGEGLAEFRAGEGGYGVALQLRPGECTVTNGAGAASSLERGLRLATPTSDVTRFWLADVAGFFHPLNPTCPMFSGDVFFNPIRGVTSGCHSKAITGECNPRGWSSYKKGSTHVYSLPFLV